MSATVTEPGVIDPQRLYTFSTFSKLTGVGKAGIREARRKGLEVRYDGRGGWILGQWWIDYVITNGKSSR